MLASALVTLFLVPYSTANVTVARTAEPIAIDGSIDEPAWASAPVIEDFVGFRPEEGRAPSQRTRVRILRDDHRLYFAFEALDTHPAGIRGKLSDRDAISDDDFVALIVDPFQDGRRAFILLVNPVGSQSDCVFVEGSFGDDCTWDLVFSSAGRTGPDGYTVEVAVPFSNIRFDPSREAWGLQLLRWIARESEQLTWPERRSALGSPLKQMGTMRGMGGIPARTSVAIIPELTVGAGPGAVAGTHLAERGEVGDHDAASGDAGLTAKISRPNGALDLTVNPDFSQVESDAARIAFNERFALYYNEKRPFFLEGRELFVTPWDVVYTRTISDPLYGIKLTGKSGPSAFAILHALDESPAPSTLDPRWTPEAYRDQPAITTIGRIATEVAPDATLGALFTDKHVGGAWNRVAGADVSVLPTVDTRVAVHVLGSATDHPDGTYETGDAAKVRLFRNGPVFNWFSWYEQTTPGFRAEAGFIRRAGYREAGVQPSWRFETGRKTGLLAVSVEPGFSILNVIDSTDRERFASVAADASFRSGYVTTKLSSGVERFRNERLDKRWHVHQEIGGTPLSWLSFTLLVTGGEGIAYFAEEPYVGGTSVVALDIGVRPSERFSIGVSSRRSVFSADDPSDAAAQQLGRRGDETEFDVTVGRLTSQFFFTRSISLRVIGDFDGASRTAAPSVLLGWRPGPGTVVYAGWQDAFPTDGSEERRPGRAAFLKLSYLFGAAG